MGPIVFYPDPKYLKKLNVAIVLVLLVAVLWWSIPTFFALGLLVSPIVGIVVSVVLNLGLIVFCWWIAGHYYRSIRYEIHEDEVVVIAGIITKSVKHVPFRTVTNLKVTRGPLDRLFGLGSLAVQTAGMSGTTGAEETLAGLENVQQVYEQVAGELRRFRGALPPTQAGGELVPAPAGADNAAILAAILDELRAVRARLDRE